MMKTALTTAALALALGFSTGAVAQEAGASVEPTADAEAPREISFGSTGRQGGEDSTIMGGSGGAPTPAPDDGDLPDDRVALPSICEIDPEICEPAGEGGPGQFFEATLGGWGVNPGYEFTLRCRTELVEASPEYPVHTIGFTEPTDFSSRHGTIHDCFRDGMYTNVPKFTSDGQPATEWWVHVIVRLEVDDIPVGKEHETTWGTGTIPIHSGCEDGDLFCSLYLTHPSNRGTNLRATSQTAQTRVSQRRPNPRIPRLNSTVPLTYHVYVQHRTCGIEGESIDWACHF